MDPLAEQHNTRRIERQATPRCASTRNAGLLLVLIAMVGCSDLKERESTLEQKQRESIAEKTTARVVQDSVIVPAPTVIETTGRNGETTKIEVPAVSHTHTDTTTTAGAASDSAASGHSAQAESFPLFVKLIGVGVGLLVLLLVWWLIRRSSKAVDAAWVAADGMVASKIHNLRTHQTASTDPNVIAALKTQEAELQRLRAEMLAP